MKNLFKLLMILALLATTYAKAQVTLDCESGNRTIEQGNCWGFGAVSYTNTSGLVISGSIYYSLSEYRHSTGH